MLAYLLTFAILVSPVEGCTERNARVLFEDWLSKVDDRGLGLLGIDRKSKFRLSHRLAFLVQGKQIEPGTTRRWMYAITQNKRIVALLGVEESETSCNAISFGHTNVAHALQKAGLTEFPLDDQPELLLDLDKNQYFLRSIKSDIRELEVNEASRQVEKDK